MFGIHGLPLFVASGLLLNMVPGPDSLLVVARSAGQGWRSGSAAAFGIAAGTFVHVLAAALGLSALLAASATTFGALKLAGAAYLVYIGIRLLLARPAPHPVAVPVRAAARHGVFAQGLLTNLLNPKVALFFLAFVPQFIDPAAHDKAVAFIALGCIFNINSLLWSHGLALTAAAAGRRMRSGRRPRQALSRLTGAVFVAFGVRLAVAARH